MSGALQPMSGALQPMSGALQPMNGALQPMNGALQPTSGALQPTSGDLQPVNGVLQPMSGALQSMSGALCSGLAPPSAWGSVMSDGDAACGSWASMVSRAESGGFLPIWVAVSSRRWLVRCTALAFRHEIMSSEAYTMIWGPIENFSTANRGVAFRAFIPSLRPPRLHCCPPSAPSYFWQWVVHEACTSVYDTHYDRGGTFLANHCMNHCMPALGGRLLT